MKFYLAAQLLKHFISLGSVAHISLGSIDCLMSLAKKSCMTMNLKDPQNLGAAFAAGEQA